MSDSAMHGRLDLLLSELRLPSIRKLYRKVAKEVASAGGDYAAFLLTLLEEEAGDRATRRIQRRIKEARFRQLKHLSELKIEALPEGISIDLINELAAGNYLNTPANIVAIGGSGTGKTHVCTGLALAVCHQGKRVRFYSATELVCELIEAQDGHQLHRYLRRFAGWDLVVIDELGYLPITENGADLLFQALSERHEKGSVIVNSNLPFSEWGQIFKNERLAVALLDRITHNAHILEMNGESYRLQSARKRKKKSG